MALFIDGTINSLQDLERHENSLLDIASVEQIDLTAKMALAQDDIAADLLMFLLKQTPRDPSNILFSYQAAAVRRVLGISDVVITEPLQRWHALHSIELAYQDAYNNQLNDRYKGKWLQYQQRSATAAAQLLQIGVGLVANPIARPGEPLLLSIAGPLSAATYYAQLTCLNRLGQESAPSLAVSLQTIDGSQLVVSPPDPPAGTVGWNIYAGLTLDTVSMQNSGPLPVQGDWTLPATGLVLGVFAGSGQSPEYYAVNYRTLQRG